jgi:beta-mannosidase
MKYIYNKYIFLIEILVVSLTIAEITKNGEPVTEIHLNTHWDMINSQDSSYNVQNLTIPFSVHSALLKDGKIKDPYYRYNDLELRWIPKNNYWKFLNKFTIEDGQNVINNSIINLEFYSIDSIAKVYLNGHFVLFAQNEFLKYTIENVNSKLKSKEDNLLEISFLSPIEYARNISNMYPYRIPVEFILINLIKIL